MNYKIIGIVAALICVIGSTTYFVKENSTLRVNIRNSNVAATATTTQIESKNSAMSQKGSGQLLTVMSTTSSLVFSIPACGGSMTGAPEVSPTGKYSFLSPRFKDGECPDLKNRNYFDGYIIVKTPYESTLPDKASRAGFTCLEVFDDYARQGEYESYECDYKWLIKRPISYTPYKEEQFTNNGNDWKYAIYQVQAKKSCETNQNCSKLGFNSNLIERYSLVRNGKVVATFEKELNSWYQGDVRMMDENLINEAYSGRAYSNLRAVVGSVRPLK